MDGAVQSMGDLALGQAMAAAPKPAGKSIDKVASDFEGMFMTQMLQPMFETVGVDKVFGGGHGEEVMRSFLVQEYGKVAAKAGHFGIAAAVKNELIRTQAKMNARNAQPEGVANAAGS